ncbi:MAG: carbohydrate ABC transporter permease [Actinomycetota bacterium]|nr:carbohydrate ABC transporter permease [Actinomycetota bacterium]
MSLADARLAPRKRSASTGSILRRTIAYAALILLALISLLPFAWMLSTSLKQSFEVFVFPPQWIPAELQWSNYTSLWTSFQYWNLWIFNSFKIVAFAVVGQLLFCSMSAYAFARLNFPGRDLIFYLYLGSMMVPDIVNTIPTYIMMQNLGLLDTHASLILPALASAIGIFMLRQFFLSLPRELEEAARVDGAGYWRIYWDIILPLSKPALATFAVFLFIWTWSDFLGPLIYLSTDSKFTLPVGLALLNDQYNSDWERLMAGNVVGLIPLVIVYAAAQRYIVQGIALTGIK